VCLGILITVKQFVFMSEAKKKEEKARLALVKKTAPILF